VQELGERFFCADRDRGAVVADEFQRSQRVMGCRGRCDVPVDGADCHEVNLRSAGEIEQGERIVETAVGVDDHVLVGVCHGIRT
jgi:hypothetical protein